MCRLGAYPAHSMLALTQRLQAGFCSSHLTRLARHVRQPVRVRLLTSLMVLRGMVVPLYSTARAKRDKRQEGVWRRLIRAEIVVSCD